MKILLKYLKPYKWLVVFTLTLAAINIGFSLVDPILLGKLINLANTHQGGKHPSEHNFDYNRFFNSFSWKTPGVWFLLICSISVAMISRIAKNFQDYFLNVDHSKIWCQVFLPTALQHAMKLALPAI